MELIETPLEDCFVVNVPKFGDERGFFMESFNQKKLTDLGLDFEVKQINFAKSGRNVLRGLHYQKEPFAQAKLVGVITGAVVDVAVDLRPGSPTYGKSFKALLNKQDKLFLVPRGFAHGYYTLADDTIFYYAVDNFYSPGHESGVRYDDPHLNIDWGFEEQPIISEKDLKQPYLNI